MYWAYELAHKVIDKNPNKEVYICCAGVSPSGTAHIGNFRDIATSFFVAQALIKLGKKVRLLFSWDDFDRLRKVPINVSAIAQDFECNIGKPYSLIDDPFRTHSSFADHFEKEFEQSLSDLGIHPEFIYQTKEYMSGRYLEYIKLALASRREIYDITMSFKTQEADNEARESYFPITVYCRECHKDSTKVISYDENTGDIKYFCSECKAEHTVNVNNYNLIKLAWKIDWPMRWLVEGVDFEPGGIDHATVGGSYDVCKVIAKKIFNHEAPVFQGYGWLDKQGQGNMHSSTGINDKPDDVLQVFEPDVVKWIFAKYKPEDKFFFAFDDTVIRHYSEFDKMIAEYKSGNSSDVVSEMFDLILTKGKDTPNRTSFASIASIAPIVDFNLEATRRALQKAGITLDTESETRFFRVKNWIEHYNTNKMYSLLPTFNEEYYASMSEEDKSLVNQLCEFITANEFGEREIQQKLYDIINDPNLTKKENVERQKQQFKNLYNLLFGRDDGPRLYLFLTAVQKDKYLNLLMQK